MSTTKACTCERGICPQTGSSGNHGFQRRRTPRVLRSWHLTLIGQQSLQVLRPSQHLLQGWPEKQIKCTVVEEPSEMIQDLEPVRPELTEASSGSEAIQARFYLLFLRAFSKLFPCTPVLIFCGWRNGRQLRTATLTTSTRRQKHQPSLLSTLLQLFTEKLTGSLSFS